MKRHRARAVGVLRNNAGMLANSSLLAFGSVLAAGLGFVYWWFAAREFPPAAVGAQSALISTMALVSMLGDVGFSTLLLGRSGGRGRDGHPLIIAAAMAGTGTSLLLGALAAGAFCYENWMTGWDAVLFAIGCALTGLSFVIDNGFIGLGQSRLQFARSTLFSILKLVLLVLVGLVTRAAPAILLTWVLSLVVALALSCGHAWARGVLRLVKPDFRGLMDEASVVVHHHFLNLSAAAPGLILPLVVSTCLSPAVNAAFYVGWMVRSVAILGPASLTTVLFSLDSSSPDVMRQKIRFSLMLSLAISTVGLIGFVLLGNVLLRMFNPTYPSLAGAAMPMIGISLIGDTVRLHYVLLSRVNRNMMAGSCWLTLGGCAEVALAALGGLFGNVHWLALGWVVALIGTAAFLARPLFNYVKPVQTSSLVGAAVSSISRR
jgi:O-antigen/teichoic acid export membrane protein